MVSRTALLIFALAMMVVVIVPTTPVLWPAQTILNRVDAHHSPPIPRIRRTWIVYDTYGARPEMFLSRPSHPCHRDANPRWVSWDLMNRKRSLWRPILVRAGSCRFVTMTRRRRCRHEGIKYALVSERFFCAAFADDDRRMASEHERNSSSGRFELVAIAGLARTQAGGCWCEFP